MKTLTIPETKNLILAVLERNGFPLEQTEIICKFIMYAELRGNNQGLAKLESMKYTPEGEVKIVRNFGATALLGANKNHPMVVLERAKGIAVSKAKRYGIAIVGINGTSTSSGAIGYVTSSIASTYDLVAILCATTIPIMTPHGGAERRVGTNPISIAFPSNDEPIVFDATPAQWAYFGLVEAAAKGVSIPEGVALNREGKPTTDSKEAVQGMLLPKGVFGWGIAVAIQLLAGPLIGALRDQNDTNNWGHTLIVIDPPAFQDISEFKKQVEEFAEWVHTAKKLGGVDRIYLPGERGNELSSKRAEENIISLPDSLFQKLNEIANGI